MQCILSIYKFFFLQFIEIISAVFGKGSSQEVPVEKIVAAPGSDALLRCLFPVKPNMDFESLIVNWRHGDTVVHSFYRRSDQLEKQSEVYNGRTSLFHDQLPAGNASLMLKDIQPEHNGEYKCYVTCNSGLYAKKVHLLVAAPYDEPEIAVEYLCEKIVISLSSHSFPQPVVTWFVSVGYENTTLTPDSRGRYRLQSNMTLNLNSTETVRVEMSLDAVSQKFSWAVTLHPHPAHSALLWSRGSSQEVPVEKIVAAPGSDALLRCLFPVKPNMDFEMLVINWQHGDTVVHSFYRRSDQLEKQSEVYNGRTSLFHDQLPAGNASLMLTDIQPEHNGEYKCYVTCNNGPYDVQKVQLLVAAPYDEPEIAVEYLCENIVVSLSSHGFPQPVVTWSAPLGYENTTLVLDSRGFYRLQSNITLNLNSTETVRVEMSLDVVSQKFSRAVTLHPHPACCEEQSPRCRIGFGIAIVVLIPAFLMLLLQRKQ
ncbi:hypothetical protein IRJ41_002323 [Triplophysa rosa]|uniref:Ig-like domain-containing protein n=1 Tax=Triplophysa rosa TaxID=992332 RepID=A0A9W7WPU0_TRIRA|nr:hypothetical protein IRJ41_002323 [Triplophysa rosa]